MLNRREFIAVSAGAGAVLALGVAPAAAATDMTAVIEKFAGAAGTEGGISVEAPEIAENGNTVPVGFTVDAKPEEVEKVALYADGNPNPEVAFFTFSALAGAASASTRIRLAGTQNLYAVAKMKDGSVRVAKREVKVTIGGCGG